MLSISINRIVIACVFSTITTFMIGQTFQRTYYDVDGDQSWSMNLCHDNGYIFTGYKESSMFKRLFLFKIDSLGIVEWSNATNALISGTHISEGLKVIETNDKGFACLGQFTFVPSYPSISFVLKVDSIGNLQWIKQYKFPPLNSGLTLKNIIQTNDGGYALCGSDGDTALTGMNIMKINGLGVLQWYRTLEMYNHSSANSLLEESDGSLILTGSQHLPGLTWDEDIVLIKFDANGNMIWSYKFGYSGSTLSEAANSIIKVNDGYILAGDKGYNGNGFILKVDNSKKVKWMKSVPHSVTDIEMSADSSLVALCYDYWGVQHSELISFTKSGNLKWKKKYGGTVDILPSGLEINKKDEIAFAGRTFLNIPTLPFSYQNTTFLKTDSLGVTDCNESISSSVILDTTITDSIFPVNVYVRTNVITSTPIFPFSVYGIDTLSPCTFFTSINESGLLLEMNIYPNPGTGQFNFSGLEKESKIEIYDVMGRKVYEAMVSNSTQIIDLTSKDKGVYFYRIISDKEKFQQGKLLIQ